MAALWGRWSICLNFTGYGAMLLALAGLLWAGSGWGRRERVGVELLALASSPAAPVDPLWFAPSSVGAAPREIRSPGADISPQLIDKEMLALLKTARLESGPSAMAMPASVAERMPHKIGGLDGEDRKKLFIDVMLPTVMIVLDEVRQERRQLLAILSEMGGKVTELTFAAERLDWQRRVGPEKTKFLLALTRKYQTENAAELVSMVDVLPPSLILAQGALESSWGGSYYAREVNNLFGMYVKESHRAARQPKIMEFRSILDCVRAYVLNINRATAYKELRRIRSQTLDPMRIADGLTEYSERKQLYIADVKRLIAANRLRHYDHLLLATG